MSANCFSFWGLPGLRPWRPPGLSPNENSWRPYTGCVCHYDRRTALRGHDFQLPPKTTNLGKFNVLFAVCYSYTRVQHAAKLALQAQYCAT